MLVISRQRESGLRQDTIEPAIAPKIIPYGIQFQIAVVNDTKGQLHQFGQFVESSVTVSDHNEYCREIHLAHGTLNCINARRKYLGGAPRMAECLFVLPKPRFSDR